MTKTPVSSSKSTTPLKVTDLSQPEDFIGKDGVWLVKLQNVETTVRVRILGFRRRWGRIDFEVETNTGARLWASNRTLTVVSASLP